MLRLQGNDVGNRGLDAVFTHLHHLPKLKWFGMDATIDSSCSTLVRECLHAVGEDIPGGGGKIRIRADSKEHIVSSISLLCLQGIFM